MFYLEKRSKDTGIGRKDIAKWNSYGAIQKWFEKRLHVDFNMLLDLHTVSKADLQRLTVDCWDAIEDEQKAKLLFPQETYGVFFLEEIERTAKKLQHIIDVEVDWNKCECNVYRY